MPLTPEQLQKEKANEAFIDTLSEKVIGYTGWGKFYPLMRAAASVGEGATPHQICVSSDGRDVVVYKKGIGKAIALFSKPAHEYAAHYVATKEYGKAALSLLGFGQALQNKEEKKATCITVTPNQVVNAVQSINTRSAESGRLIDNSGKEVSDKIIGIPKPYFYTGIAAISFSAIVITIYAMTRK